MPEPVAVAAPHHPALRHHFSTLEQQREASSLGMWVFIAQEVLFFGGLFVAYAVYRHQYPVAFSAGSHHLSWRIGFANTLVLIGSSLTMAMAVHSAAVGKSRRIVGYLLATILLGSVFLGVKYFEYREKIRPCLGDGPSAGCLLPGDRFDPSVLHLEGDEGQHAQIYFSLYFGMTGLHALHMIIGIPIILTIAVLAGRGAFSPEYHSPVEIVGLYWHFVDIIWIFLFPLLYLIGAH
ncbi:MAG TPA: cytochrome c oxidase subunit 3 family protein [Vicinamibacteria bacterium]|nr:cytochrome c oxidase subunit 3 family protein [Vicinamibacteria bacterium]